MHQLELCSQHCRALLLDARARVNARHLSPCRLALRARHCTRPTLCTELMALSLWKHSPLLEIAQPSALAGRQNSGALSTSECVKWLDEICERLTTAPPHHPLTFCRLQDGTVGSARGREVRVRVISDCPVMSLAARALLHRTPLYAAQVFPRAITVYSTTRSYVRADAAVHASPAQLE